MQIQITRRTIHAPTQRAVIAIWNGALPAMRLIIPKRLREWLTNNQWRDTPKRGISSVLVDLFGLAVVVTMIVAIAKEKGDLLLVSSFFLLPIFAIFGALSRRRHALREHDYRKNIGLLLSDAEKAIARGDLGEFEWSLWKTLKLFLRRTQDPYSHAVLRLIHRSLHVGLSEELRPHILEPKGTAEEIAEHISRLGRALINRDYAETAESMAGLYSASVYSVEDKQPVKRQALDLKQNTLDTLRDCSIELQENRIGRAIGRVSNLLSDIGGTGGSPEAKWGLLLGNWLSQKLRELEQVEPGDVSILWLPRFQLLARHLENAIVAYEEDDALAMMNAIVDSYDRLARRLRFSSWRRL